MDNWVDVQTRPVKGYLDSGFLVKCTILPRDERVEKGVERLASLWNVWKDLERTHND